MVIKTSDFIKSVESGITIGSPSNGLSIADGVITLATATSTEAGAMSIADKTKLDSAATTDDIPGINIVANDAALDDIENPVKGDQAIVTTNNEQFVYDGENWITRGNVVSGATFKKNLKGKTVTNLNSLATELDLFPIAQPFYVDTDNGEDSNVGSQSEPFKTLEPITSAANISIFIKGSANITGRSFTNQHVAIHSGWLKEEEYKNNEIEDEGGRFTGRITSRLFFGNAEATLNAGFATLGLNPVFNLNSIQAVGSSNVFLASQTNFDVNSVTTDAVAASSNSSIYIASDIQIVSQPRYFCSAQTHSRVLINDGVTIVASAGVQPEGYFRVDTNGYIYIGNTTHGNSEITGGAKISVGQGGIIERAPTEDTVETEYNTPSLADSSTLKGWKDYPTVVREIGLVDQTGSVTYDVDEDFPPENRVIFLRNVSTTGTTEVTNLDEGTQYIPPESTLIVFRNVDGYESLLASTIIEDEFEASEFIVSGLAGLDKSLIYTYTNVALTGHKFITKVVDENGNEVTVDQQYLSNGIRLIVNRYPNASFAGKLLISMV